MSTDQAQQLGQRCDQNDGNEDGSEDNGQCDGETAMSKAEKHHERSEQS
ncbi:MAG: hypothetical protein OEZ19_02735 [Paracoccaceae bacterium]|nr:hypothetical protein [Paracoccaceae bacterium]